MTDTTDYAKQPRTAVLEGLGSALVDCYSQRESLGLPELNLTDEEEEHIVNTVTGYLHARFAMHYRQLYEALLYHPPEGVSTTPPDSGESSATVTINPEWKPTYRLEVSNG